MAKRKKQNPRDDALGEYDRLGEKIEAARAELDREGDEMEDPAERQLLDEVLLPAESYYHQLRDDPDVDYGIDGLLSVAPNKLGPVGEVYAFNRTTGGTCCREGTGPGGTGTLATEACKKVCYARKLEQIRTYWIRWSWNDDVATNPQIDFAKLMIGLLSARSVTQRAPSCLRIHSCGEFDSPEYVRMWATIAKACYWIRFWTYTRAWVRDDMLPALRELNALPNARVLLSYDRDLPSLPADLRSSYLSRDNTDLPPEGDRPLVVFRARKHTRISDVARAEQLFVCPHQDGVKNDVAPDCVDCGVCLPPLRDFRPPVGE